MRKIISISLAFVIFSHAPSLATSCIIDPKKFDFLATSGQIFYFGTEQKVKEIYEKLAKEIATPENYGQTTIFYAQGDFQRLFTSICTDDKCKGSDILRGLQNCSSSVAGSSQQNLCYPLAVVYSGRVYCLLAPALDNYTGKKDYKPFNPYEMEKD